MTGTITLLARDWKLDVSTDGTNWIPLSAMTDFSPTITPNNVDTSDYDTNGWDSWEPTMQAWKIAIKLNRKSTSGVKDPGQELLRACQGQFGDAARAYIRYYRRADGTEAKSGRAIIEWARSKTAKTDVSEIQVTATGDGILTDLGTVAITPPVPTILTVTPSGAAAAAQITISGSAFLTTVATTGVKVGGTNAVPFTVVSDNAIVATMPAGSAGGTTIVVTNTTGASASFAYTRA